MLLYTAYSSGAGFSAVLDISLGLSVEVDDFGKGLFFLLFHAYVIVVLFT